MFYILNYLLSQIQDTNNEVDNAIEAKRQKLSIEKTEKIGQGSNDVTEPEYQNQIIKKNTTVGQIVIPNDKMQIQLVNCKDCVIQFNA